MAQLYPFALQLTQPLGFWTTACRCIEMRRYDEVYRSVGSKTKRGYGVLPMLSVWRGTRQTKPTPRAST